MKSLARNLLLTVPFVRELKDTVKETRANVAHLQSELNHLRMVMAESRLATDGRKLDEILALLKPMKVVGFDKIRLGADHDGGYVMLDDFSGVTRAYSLGIYTEVSWDCAMADRGIRVSQFDYSIDKTPVPRPEFTFHKKRVESLADLGLAAQPGQILKIDIEGSEWGLFRQAAPGELPCFHQIFGEFHDFDRFYESAWQQTAVAALRRLNETHQLIHVHGNNWAPSFDTGKLKLPVSLELTYASKSKYKFAETDEKFPGPLDRPNIRHRPDPPLDALWT